MPCHFYNIARSVELETDSETEHHRVRERERREQRKDKEYLYVIIRESICRTEKYYPSNGYAADNVSVVNHTDSI